MILAVMAFTTAAVLAFVWLAAGTVAALVVLGLWLIAGIAVAVLHHLARRAGLNHEERHR